MRLPLVLGVCTALAIAAPAVAQEASAAPVAASLTLKEGLSIVSADGRRVGRIERLQGDRAAPSTVSVIKDGRFVYIPANTLTASDGGRVQTSLKYKEIR